MTDAGKYSLLADNKNGTDHVDLDLIVIDEVPVCDCDMFLNGSLDCGCNNRYRSEIKGCASEFASIHLVMNPILHITLLHMINVIFIDLRPQRKKWPDLPT